MREKMQPDKGASIEDESMRIIEEEIGDHRYADKEWSIVRRVIHSTADFDFARSCGMIFHPDAIRNGIKALRRGSHIVADVNGVGGLLNKKNLRDFGNSLVCRISDSEVVDMAAKHGMTRSQASMRISAAEIDGGVVAIGNAPTALLEVIKMAAEGVVTPSLVIGMPVGFVAAAESKDELAATGIVHITNRGRKGGSSSAAAIVNALFKLLRESRA